MADANDLLQELSNPWIRERLIARFTKGRQGAVVIEQKERAPRLRKCFQKPLGMKLRLWF
jgi:hypothetical protein